MSALKSATRRFRIAFDVNGTLTHPTVQALFRALNRDDCFVVVWSSMGASYAREFCESHGFEADAYWDKNEKEVDLAIDDVGSTVSAASLLFEVVRKF